MDRKELTDLLVTSYENSNQAKFIPWWLEDYENYTYRYGILSEDIIRNAETCITECGKEELLSSVGSFGFTLFHLLVLHNFYDAVEKILCDGRITEEDINIPDRKGNGLTPFLLACACGNLAMVKLLLDHGANDSLNDSRNRNAYHFLACPKLGDRLVCNSSCLERSVEQRAEIARLLTCDMNQKSEEGLTPLEKMLSVSNNPKYTWPLTEIFLEKGAKTDYVDQEGNTLLMMALENDHRTAAFRLMQHCPEMIHTANNDGVTPLEHTTDYCEDALCFALVDHGAAPLDDNTVDIGNMDVQELSELVRSAFDRTSDENRDGLDLALYITEKLIRQVDPDDDDELMEVTDVLHCALRFDAKAHVLDLCKDAGLSFTQPIYSKGKVLCLRDECLGTGYHVGVLQKLMELGVNMDTAITEGRTPAYILASDDRQTALKHENFFEKAAELFSKESMEQTDNGGEAAVHLAVKNGHTGMLKTMIEKGVNMDLTEDAPAEAGMTPLHLACIHGRPDAVKLLLAAGADDTAKNSKGKTPAHLVLMKDRYGRELELEQKADLLKELVHLDIPDEDGQAPLMLLKHATRELLPLFIEKGADVNHRDHYGRTAMMLSMDKDIIKELLRAGAHINTADNAGNTVLHYALKNGSTGEARYLIRKGADYTHPNNEGETPAQIAVEKGYDTVLELMTDKL